MHHAADVLGILCGSGGLRSKRRGLRAETKLTNISIQSSYSVTWDMQDNVKPTKVGGCSEYTSTLVHSIGKPFPHNIGSVHDTALYECSSEATLKKRRTAKALT